MKDIPVGVKGVFTMEVKHEHLASTIDPSLPPVLATGWMVVMMERAAMNALASYLEPGEASVGASISVQHTAATPEGHVVTAEAELVKVDGRKLEFRVSAVDEIEPIGSGTHQRVIIRSNKFQERIASKVKR